MALRRFFRPELIHAAKVAAAASLLVGIVYAACVTVLDHVVATRLTESVDARLADRLADVRQVGLRESAADDDDIDTTPVYLWRVTPAGPAVAAAPGTPALPATLRLVTGRTATVRLEQGKFRLAAGTADGQPMLAGQSLQSVDHLIVLLRLGESVACPVLLLAMFSGALTIGLRALSPVERARKRQLDFTADASHELRTPLSVISAETSVALSTPRSAADYKAVLGRISGESDRLRKIVDDLLWLARFDSTPPDPGDEPLDLATIAAQCADRFRAIAAARGFTVEVAADGPGPAWIRAPAEWIDRLSGVLADNAGRHAGPHGTVRLGVSQRGGRVTLAVEDSGPGVPPEVRDRLFDRFHRSVADGGSAGLGLAIADSIVRSTDGQWRVGSSDLGGALFEVSWRRAPVRHASVAAQHGPGPAGAVPASQPAADGPAAGSAAGPASG